MKKAYLMNELQKHPLDKKYHYDLEEWADEALQEFKQYIDGLWLESGAIYHYDKNLDKKAIKSIEIIKWSKGRKTVDVEIYDFHGEIDNSGRIKKEVLFQLLFDNRMRLASIEKKS